MAKSYISNGVLVAAGPSVSTFAQQIAAGEGIFDIAVKNGIRFYSGQDDDEGILWDGVSPLEVVIPTISDIVADPVHLVGIVGVEGVPPVSPTNGDLVYITADCIFADGSQSGVACEAGDMAIYYANTWHIIQGENQVTIIGTPSNNVVTVALSGVAQRVLNVEGTNLDLGVDYSDVRSKVSIVRNDSDSWVVGNGTVTVSPKYVGLSKTADVSRNITTVMSIDLPTALASGFVTIDSVLQSGDFTFTSGSLPTIAMNAEAISVNASHNMTIAKNNVVGDFVTDVDAIKAVTFGEGTANSNDFTFVASLSAASGTSFISNIRTYNSDTDSQREADLNLWGQATVSNSTFVSGLSEESTSGDLVSAISIGAVSLDSTGSGILTGIDVSGTDFLTAVSFGNVAQDATIQWFFSGLNVNGSQVVTDVTVGAVTFVSGNSDGFTGSAVTSASVSNHVLTFTTGTFMTPVSISQVSSTVEKADFAKSGVKIENTGVSQAGFTSASLVQGETSISYKSIVTGDVTLSQSSVSYVFDKAEDHNYTGVMGYVKASTTAADVTKNGAKIENPTITASISANTVAVSLLGGVLPSLTIGNPTGTISGTVDTSLTTSNVSWLAVDESKKTITTAGEYSFIEVSSEYSGAVAVASPSTYDLDNATVSVAANIFVTDVLVDGQTVSSTNLPTPTNE